jgi:hypothetical protein
VLKGHPWLELANAFSVKWLLRGILRRAAYRFFDGSGLLFPSDQIGEETKPSGIPARNCRYQTMLV